MIKPLKQLPISTEHEVKDSLVIGQDRAGFRSSVLKIWIMKIKKEDNVHAQLMINILKHSWKKRHVKVLEKCFEQWVSAFQRYLILCRKFDKLVPRELSESQNTTFWCVFYAVSMELEKSISWSNSDLSRKEDLLWSSLTIGSMAWIWRSTQTRSKTKISCVISP